MENDYLCESCLEFDYEMNKKNSISLDILIVCDHENKPKTEQEAKERLAKFYESKAD